MRGKVLLKSIRETFSKSNFIFSPIQLDIRILQRQYISGMSQKRGGRVLSCLGQSGNEEKRKYTEFHENPIVRLLRKRNSVAP